MGVEDEPTRGKEPHEIFTRLVKDAEAAGGSGFAASKPDDGAWATSFEVTAAVAASMPETVTFDGFMLGPLEYNERTWWAFYTDRNRQSWILIDDAAKVDFQPGNKRSDPDTVWVARHGTVVRGSGARDIELMFLSGSLTTAGDLAQALGSRGGSHGGLFDPMSPPLCNCGKKTTG
jgi:hypothetical protein